MLEGSGGVDVGRLEREEGLGRRSEKRCIFGSEESCMHSHQVDVDDDKAKAQRVQDGGRGNVQF